GTTKLIDLKHTTPQEMELTSPEMWIECFFVTNFYAKQARRYWPRKFIAGKVNYADVSEITQLERNGAFKVVSSQEKNPQRPDGIDPSKAFFDKARETNGKSPIQSGTLPVNELSLKSNVHSSELFIIPRGISPEKELLSKNRALRIGRSWKGRNKEASRDGPLREKRASLRESRLIRLVALSQTTLSHLQQSLSSPPPHEERALYPCDIGSQQLALTCDRANQRQWSPNKYYPNYDPYKNNNGSTEGEKEK
ncbi:hypothetical protein RJ640_010044, partial [Escallonia rubra]